MSDAALKVVMREVIRRNGVDDGIVYLQITPRRRRRATIAFPKARAAGAGRDRAPRIAGPTRGSVDDGIARHHDPRHPLGALRHQIGGAACRTCSASSRRSEAGAYEAWQVDRDGKVTEGTSTNAWIVTARRRGGDRARPTTRS